MSEKLEITVENGVLQAKIPAYQDVAEYKAHLRRVARECQARGLDKAVLDLGRLSAEASVGDIHDIGRDLAVMIDAGKIKCAAIENPVGGLPTRFLESATRNHTDAVKTFAELDAAVNWLHGKTDPLIRHKERKPS